MNIVAAHETQGRKSIHTGNGDYSMMILNTPNGSRRMKKKEMELTWISHSACCSISLLALESWKLFAVYHTVYDLDISKNHKRLCIFLLNFYNKMKQFVQPFCCSGLIYQHCHPKYNYLMFLPINNIRSKDDCRNHLSYSSNT